MPRWENIRPIWNVETEMIKKSGLEICKILLDFKLKNLSHYEIVYFFVNSLNSIAILEKFRYLLKKEIPVSILANLQFHWLCVWYN